MRWFILNHTTNFSQDLSLDTNRILNQIHVNQTQNMTTCKFNNWVSKNTGWNEREIHSKEDENYLIHSDDDENAVKKQCVNGNKIKKTEVIYQNEKSDHPTKFSTPSITNLKLDSIIVSNSPSEEKQIDNKLLNKKHGLDKIALYEDCNDCFESDLYDIHCVASSNKLFI